MVDVGLELRPLGLVVLDLGVLDISGKAGRGAVTARNRLVEIVQRAERVAAVVRAREIWLVVGVVLVVVRALPQPSLLERRQEPVDRVERRDRVAGAGLAVERPGTADVGPGRIARVEVRGVVPVARRHPVVRSLLLARVPESRPPLVLGGGDQRIPEVRLAEALQRDRFLARSRVVVTPAEVQDAGVVTEVLPDRAGGVVEHLEVVLARQLAVLELPRVAALEAAVDQDPGAVHLLIEVLGHLLALGADAVQPQVLDRRDLGGGVGGGVAQEQVLRPAAATEHERSPVDHELARAVRRERRGADQARGDGADPERLGLRVRRLTGLTHAHRQPVERLRSHLIRPPHARVRDHQPEAHGTRRAGGHPDRLAHRESPRAPGQSRDDRSGSRGGGLVADESLDREPRAREAGRIVLHHVDAAERQRPRRVQLDRELDPGVVVRRDLRPVDVVEREHLGRIVRVQLQRERVGAPAQEPGHVECVSGVVPLDGCPRGDPDPVQPHVGRAHDAVDDQLGVLRAAEARGERGAKPPWDPEHGDRVPPDLAHVAEAALQVRGEEHVRAVSGLDERTDLGPGRPGGVRADVKPGAGGEARARDEPVGLRCLRAALDLPPGEPHGPQRSRGCRWHRGKRQDREQCNQYALGGGESGHAQLPWSLDADVQRPRPDLAARPGEIMHSRPWIEPAFVRSLYKCDLIARYARRQA